MSDVLDALFVAVGLPAPVREHKFHPKRRWRFDYAWLCKSLALEVEGGVWTRGRHTRGKGFLADVEKYNEAALLGWTVLRCTPQQLNSGEAVELVRKVYESR